MAIKLDTSGYAAAVLHLWKQCILHLVFGTPFAETTIQKWEIHPASLQEPCTSMERLVTVVTLIANGQMNSCF